NINDNDSGTTKITFVNNAKFTGSGTLTVQNIGSWGQDTYQVGGDNSGYSGAITIASHGGIGIRLQPTSGTNNSLGSGPVNIQDTSQVFFSSAGITYGNTFNITGIGSPVDSPS